MGIKSCAEPESGHINNTLAVQQHWKINISDKTGFNWYDITSSMCQGWGGDAARHNRWLIQYYKKGVL